MGGGGSFYSLQLSSSYSVRRPCKQPWSFSTDRPHSHNKPSFLRPGRPTKDAAIPELSPWQPQNARQKPVTTATIQPVSVQPAGSVTAKNWVSVQTNDRIYSNPRTARAFPLVLQIQHMAQAWETSVEAIAVWMRNLLPNITCYEGCCGNFNLLYYCVSKKHEST